jgi:5-oxopent-3-ene-1,2,5-tricarboxylate decarboxylase/2-hydroxyhepta-2,4-diene-1,7-dioate isomerase
LRELYAQRKISTPMKHARVLLSGQPLHGIVEEDAILLDDGMRIGTAVARHLPPFTPRQVFAARLNYRSRCAEHRIEPLPAYPSYFMKPLGSISYHRAEVARPRGCLFLNYEGEIAVVIGRTCSNVPVANALRCVKGYTVANDFGVHDFRHADGGSLLRVKGHDGFCPLGPVLTDAGDIDPQDLWLRTYVNGRQVQEAHTGRDAIFSIAYQIADLSRLITLEENDVLLTGTPANSRPVEIGDVVAVEVSGIGRLENTIVELARELVEAGAQPGISANTLEVALAIPETEALELAKDFYPKDFNPKDFNPKDFNPKDFNR